jgi:phosphatidylserine decarboxylase
MPISIYNDHTPEDLPGLKPLLDHRADSDFVALLEESLRLADEGARRDLDPGLYAALPFEDMEWPTTIDDYIKFLVRFAFWIPQQSTNPVWVAPNNPQGEHQEVYDHLCLFYWLIDQPVLPDDGVLQHYSWFEEFLVGYADVWGAFLDTPASFNDEMLDSFIAESPKFRVEDSMIGDPPRPNAPSGWLTFNQFFAGELNPGLRPIANSSDNTTITAPADCTYRMHYNVDADSNIEPKITIKGTHTYANVKDLLKGSAYADSFANGHFIHLFLGPYSYHRFHTPVAGVVMDCHALTGQVYLQVRIGGSKPGEPGNQFQADDFATDGYEFQQARGVLTIDTSRSPSGDVGIVAVVPIGMCQVSGVNMTHELGRECRKGDEFGYFTFGGSDIIVLFQEGFDPQYNMDFFGPEGPTYSLYGTKIATITPRSG